MQQSTKVIHAFADVMCHELIERLLVSDILCMKGSKEVNFIDVKKYINSKDDQTRAGEYGEGYNGNIKLEQFLDLHTGKWLE